MARSVLFWRRVDLAGIERLELDVLPDRVFAEGTVINLEGGGLRVDHRWRLDARWRAQEVTVRCWDANRSASLRLERDGAGWLVDGVLRPDLDGAQEPDLSVTPFCNTLPICRLPRQPGAELTLDTAYIDGAALTVVRSCQRYVREGPDKLRYIDLGVACGFEAELRVDEQGLVLRYEHLFERIAPQP